MAATVTGRLTDIQGAGLPNVEITVVGITINYVTGFAITRNDNTPIETDGSGNFSITLNPGLYYLHYLSDRLKFRVPPVTGTFIISNLIEQ